MSFISRIPYGIRPFKIDTFKSTCKFLLGEGKKDGN
jgi:hypothetical protein